MHALFYCYLTSRITEQISVGKCAHRGASAHRECQISFKIVTWTKQSWTKQSWTKHHTREGTQSSPGARTPCTVSFLMPTPPPPQPPWSQIFPERKSCSSQELHIYSQGFLPALTLKENPQNRYRTVPIERRGGNKVPSGGSPCGGKARSFDMSSFKMVILWQYECILTYRPMPTRSE